MSRNYKFHNPKGVYFVSFAVIDWLDVFTRNEYKDLILESLEFCQKKKGMEIHAWCIMTNHMHLIFRSLDAQNPELLLGDFKRFTSRSITKAIAENTRESRKEFLLAAFKKEGEKTPLPRISSCGSTNSSLSTTIFYNSVFTEMPYNTRKTP